jgi:hypothetical protein
MNCNERGRITGMAGTETTVTLHPQRLGTRMRNNIIRMLESRVIEGGWSSQSRKIATALSEKYGLQVSTNNWNGIHVIGITEEAAPLVADVVRADFAAYRLLGGGHRGYYQDRYGESMEQIDFLDQNFFIILHDKGSISKIKEILAEHTTQEMKDKAKEVANLLRGTEPIHITTFRS